MAEEDEELETALLVGGKFKPDRSEQVKDNTDFELITWVVIKGEK